MKGRSKVLNTSEAGRLGGLARSRNLTPEQIAEIGRKGGIAARGKPRKKYRRRKPKKQKSGTE
jgi:general stress protein YciG